MNNISIKIKYDAFQSNYELEDFNDIQEFRKSITQEYIANIKGTPTGRGGWAYELLIEALTDISLQDFIKEIIKGAIYSAVGYGAKKYFLKPLFEAYDRLNEANGGRVKISEFRFQFEESELIVKSITEEGFYIHLPRIFKNLSENYELFKHRQGNEFPNAIHIPVLIDKQIKLAHLHKYRDPLLAEEYITDLKADDYFRYWGLRYPFQDRNIVFDLADKSMTDQEFYTQFEFETFIAPNLTFEP